MPTSLSTNLAYPLPGAQPGDSRLLDIQAVKAALVAIDESLANAPSSGGGGVPIGGAIFAGFSTPLHTDSDNGKWLKTGDSTPVNATIADALLPFGGVAYTQFYKNTAPESANINSLVCTAENVFIGVGRTTSPMSFRSTDGINWTQSSLGVASNLFIYGIAQGAGMIVAVTGGNPSPSVVAVSSPDGITWTQRTLPSSTYWSSVVFGNDKFIATTNNTTNVYATSTDGITWTGRTFPVSDNWTLVKYGNGIFLAIINSTTAYTSPDGITWTQRILPITGSFGCLTYGNGIFVALTSNTNVAITSTDGITWTQRTIPLGTWATMHYGNGLFLAVSNSSTKAMTSPDGITWTQRTLPISGTWNSIISNTTGLFIVGSFTNSMLGTNDPTVDVSMSYGTAATTGGLNLYVRYA